MLLILAQSQVYLVELHSDVRPDLKMATFVVQQSCGCSETPAARITNARPKRAAFSMYFPFWPLFYQTVCDFITLRTWNIQLPGCH